MKKSWKRHNWAILKVLSVKEMSKNPAFIAVFKFKAKIRENVVIEVIFLGEFLKWKMKMFEVLAHFWQLEHLHHGSIWLYSNAFYHRFFSRLFLLSVMIFISVLFESVCRLINFSTHDETVSMRECIKGGK